MNENEVKPNEKRKRKWKKVKKEWNRQKQSEKIEKEQRGERRGKSSRLSQC